MAVGRHAWPTLGGAILCVGLCLVPSAQAERTRLWIDATGRPTPRAWSAIEMLAHASDDGLDPQRYEAGSLAVRALRLQSARQVDAAEAARFESDVTADSVLFLRHLAFGRVVPSAVGFDLDAPPEWRDLGALLSWGATENQLGELVSRLRSRNVQYEAIREALAQYRALAADPACKKPLNISATIRPGGALPQASALAARLAALGDLDDETGTLEGRYSPALVEAVMRFQRRHGLDADGIIGRQTAAALDVPIAARVRQLELALERWRWLPRLDGRVVFINLATFQLWAWDSDTDAPAIAMPVIAGRPGRFATPVLRTSLRAVELAPYWNIPRSIARDEVLPEIARDPGKIAREHLEIVLGAGDDAEVMPATQENLELVERGVLRLRQRPGPDNALGPVAFSIPNDHGVVLHGTPEIRLFERAQRDFSHGCVRVGDPLGLAEWALAGSDGWSQARLAAAAQADEPRRIPVPRSIAVVFFYVTAGVDPVTGDVWFRPDLYGYDAVLERALADEAGVVDASSCEVIPGFAGKPTAPRPAADRRP